MDCRLKNYIGSHKRLHNEILFTFNGRRKCHIVWFSYFCIIVCQMMAQLTEERQSMAVH